MIGLMMIRQYFNKCLQSMWTVFKNALSSGCTPQKLASSFCIGLYIAFSPFPGGHAVMMFLSKYLFGLHLPTLFIATSFNNPWTMIPFYSADYAFGYWLLRSVIGWHPTWSLSLGSLFGSGEICLWSFLIGGNVLGITVACASYPFIKTLFRQCAVTLHRHIHHQL